MAQYEIDVDSQDEFYDDSAQNHSSATQPQNQQQQQPQSVVKRKGRGFSSEEPGSKVLSGIKHFDTVKEETFGRALRSVEGWVVFVTGLNEEVTEEEVQDKFVDFGKVRDVRMNLDHRTGYVKGYAMVEFEEYQDAMDAIEDLNNKQWLGNQLKCDFCFIRPSAADSRRR